MLHSPTESQIQSAIMGLLRYKGWYVQRQNSGMIPMGEGRSRRLIRMNKAGTPDVMAFKKDLFCTSQDDRKPVTLLYVEVKRPGNKPTSLQLAVMEELEEYGATCLVAHSVDDVQSYLDKIA